MTPRFAHPTTPRARRPAGRPLAAALLVAAALGGCANAGGGRETAAAPGSPAGVPAPPAGAPASATSTVAPTPPPSAAPPAAAPEPAPTPPGAAPPAASAPPPAAPGSMPAAPPPPAPTIAPPLSPAAAQLEAGRGLIARGDAGAAVVPLREALRLEPDLVDAQASLGQALLGIGDVEGAIDELRAALRRRPDDTRARLHLATALMARQDWPRARAELEEVARRRPDALQAHYGLGAVRYTQGDLPGAITAYRRVLEIDPAHGDARYHLALALKLARRELEATREMRAAAEAGVPRAQYFLGAALAAGNGSDRDLAGAVRWWIRAAERGVPQADAALAQLRLVALGRARAAPGERAAAELAFREFRAGLWSEHPDLARPAIGAEDGVGAALVREGRAAAALPVLLREAAALGDPAQRQLEALYEQGLGDLAPYEPRILEYLQAAAAEGQLRPRLALARIYARGLGVPADVARATALLRATPHEEAQRLLRELVP